MVIIISKVMKCNIYSYSLISYIIILTLFIYYANHFNIKTVCALLRNQVCIYVLTFLPMLETLIFLLFLGKVKFGSGENKGLLGGSVVAPFAST